MIRPIAMLIAASMWQSTAASANELRDYGEYLSGECTTCHRLDGAGDGIPSIIGWEAEHFIDTMKSFRNGDRQNAAMVSVAKSLDEEQLEALAQYFGSIKPKH